MTRSWNDSQHAVRTGTASANGVELYYEVRGRGAPLLMIPGAGGDGGVFATAAERLADYFTVITYDRRAHSRSGRPDGWTHTSPDEQADDAASLLHALELTPSYVVGSSSGATITLNLTLRHPEVVRAAIAHEPPKIGVLPERDEMLAAMRERAESARQRGGYRESYADFSGWLSGVGQSAGDDLDESRERTLDNGEVWVTRELGVVDRWDIPDELAGTLSVPLTIAAGTEGGTELHQELLARYHKALTELAERVDANFTEIAGAHIPYLTHTDQFTDALVRLLDPTD